MKYSYPLVEAAALWAGINPVEIQRRIETNEQKKAVSAHNETINNYRKLDAEALALWQEQGFNCALCQKNCPDWKLLRTEDGDERHVLNCPDGYRSPPTKTPPEPLLIPAKTEPQRRTIPAPGEFSDLPEFEERLSWLREAATSNDLPVTKENVRSSDLRAWLARHFPNQQPTFLYPEQANLETRLEQITKERDELATELASLKASLTSEPPVVGKSKSSYLHLIGALLFLVRKKDNFKTNDESIRNELRDVFGDGGEPHGLSDSFLKGVFSAARKQINFDPLARKNSVITKK